jgi:transcriptional regulator with XRE-family HTH domain
MWVMNAASTLSRARSRSGLSQRELARRAGTSHSTLAAYETGRKTPSVATLDRIVRAAGFELGVEMAPSLGEADPRARGRELVEVLELAALFPARHAAVLEYPKFGGA